MYGQCGMFQGLAALWLSLVKSYSAVKFQLLCSVFVIMPSADSNVGIVVSCSIFYRSLILYAYWL